MLKILSLTLSVYDTARIEAAKSNFLQHNAVLLYQLTAAGAILFWQEQGCRSSLWGSGEEQLFSRLIQQCCHFVLLLPEEDACSDYGFGAVTEESPHLLVALALLALQRKLFWPQSCGWGARKQEVALESSVCSVVCLGTVWVLVLFPNWFYS